MDDERGRGTTDRFVVALSHKSHLQVTPSGSENKVFVAEVFADTHNSYRSF